ncbi:MAG TPA: NAD(P)H-dependent oxidoreductase [Steroidobacteraceae bacterium]|jgi:FMN-dependent NADH-azoreductase|nr:NAD(P)H-dependent oxidoreductase [Steroidobacteraceae bacterium]
MTTTTKTYLALKSSLSGDVALSSQLVDRFIAQRVAGDERDGVQADVVARDLASSPLPHLTAERFSALTTPAEQRTPAQARIAAESDGLVVELQAADVIVIGLPMYNFGVPSTLKAYFDHVARAGVTFRYTAEGPRGLLTGKKVFVIATRGGRYSGTAQDVQSAFVRQFLGFIGLTDVEFVYAEGLALGPEHRAAAIAEADRRLELIAA